MTTASPGSLGIPALTLLADSMSMTAGSSDKYSIKVTIALENTGSGSWEWIPPYTKGLLKILIPTGAGSSDLCTTDLFSKINISGSDVAMMNSPSGATGFILATTSPITYVSKTINLTFSITGVVPNSKSGIVSIQIVPGWDESFSPSHKWSDQTLTYTVTKVQTEGALDVTGIDWSADVSPVSGTIMGKGQLTWTATGKPDSCAISVNGEKITAKIGKPSGGENTWTASTLLEGGQQQVTVTATDANGNTAKGRQAFLLSGSHGSFTSLQVGLLDSQKIDLRTPVSLVQVDASERSPSLYGVFQKTSSPTEVSILKTSGSGTQNNWTDHSRDELAVGAPVPAGYETSPCAYLNGKFYIVLGSLMDTNSPQKHMLRFDGTEWNASGQSQPPVPEPIMGQAVVVHDGHLWVIGGYGASGTVYNTVYRMTPGSPDHWEVMASLTKSLCMASAAVCQDITGKTDDSRLYVFGGYTAGPQSEISLTLYEIDLGATSPPSQWSEVPVKFPLGAISSPDSLIYAFIGTVGGTLYAFLATANGSSSWYFDKQRPTYWQNLERSQLQGVAIKPASSFAYGVSTAPAPGNKFSRSDRLFFTQAAGAIGESFDSVFAYFQHSE